MVSVPAGTPAGVYTIAYQICENLNPTNCDVAEIEVEVVAPPIVANDDVYGMINGTTGDPNVGNAYDNDSLNGAPVNIADITGTVLTPATPINVGDPVPALDPATGVVSVPAGTPGGIYTIVYQICESLNPDNCDIAEVEIFIAIPAISIVKESAVITDASSIVKAGDIVEYTFRVRNEGNVILTGVTVSETSFTGSGVVPLIDFVGSNMSSPEGQLAPGEESIYTATYSLSQDDIDGGQIDNQASARGIPPIGDPISNDSDSGNPNDPNETGTPGAPNESDPTGTVLTPSPSITLIKRVEKVTTSLGRNSNIVDAGDQITYSFELINSGNVTLSDISVSDPFIGGINCPMDALAPGASMLCQGDNYTITQSDVDNGGVENTATAIGTPPSRPDGSDSESISTISDAGTDPNGESVDNLGDTETPSLDGSTDGNPGNDPTVLLITPHPELQLYKYVSELIDVNQNGFTDVGDILVYRFIVNNIGNVSLTNIFIDDPLLTVNGSAIDLAPGETDSTTFSGQYEIAQSDIVRGFVENSAIVFGTPPPTPTGAPNDPVFDVSDALDDEEETPDGDGSSDGDPTNDPSVICLPSPLVCPSPFSLTGCNNQAGVDQAFLTWLEQFTGGGCGFRVEFVGELAAPRFCGGSVEVTARLVDENGIPVEGFVCSSTFTVAEDTTAPICPRNWDVTVRLRNDICIIPPYTSISQIEADTGDNLGDNCTPDERILISYIDSLVREECSDPSATHFDERRVIRTYTFTDECGNATRCDQEITYMIDECRELTSYGRIGFGAQSVMLVPSGCNVPPIQELAPVEGECGYVEYMWLSSTAERPNGQPYVPNDLTIGTIWTLVPDAFGPTYDPGIITQNTYFVRCARNFGCCKYGESNVIGFRIDEAAECIDPGAGSANDCENSISLTAPENNKLVQEASGYNTNRTIDANIFVGNGAELLFNAKQGTELRPGFEVQNQSTLRIVTTGCDE